jgi:hypothetical protein
MMAHLADALSDEINAGTANPHLSRRALHNCSESHVDRIGESLCTVRSRVQRVDAVRFRFPCKASGPLLFVVLSGSGRCRQGAGPQQPHVLAWESHIAREPPKQVRDPQGRIDDVTSLTIESLHGAIRQRLDLAGGVARDFANAMNCRTGTTSSLTPRPRGHAGSRRSASMSSSVGCRVSALELIGGHVPALSLSMQGERPGRNAGSRPKQQSRRRPVRTLRQQPVPVAHS